MTVPGREHRRAAAVRTLLGVLITPRPQTQVKPPSITSTLPVTYEDASLAR